MLCPVCKSEVVRDASRRHTLEPGGVTTLHRCPPPPDPDRLTECAGCGFIVRVDATGARFHFPSGRPHADHPESGQITAGNVARWEKWFRVEAKKAEVLATRILPEAPKPANVATATPTPRPPAEPAPPVVTPAVDDDPSFMDGPAPPRAVPARPEPSRLAAPSATPKPSNRRGGIL